MTMTTDTRKTAIIEALHAFIHQRPGMDPRNYGDAKSYNQERREVHCDLQDALYLIIAVQVADGISADDILNADPGGRLTFRQAMRKEPNMLPPLYVVDYTTGQYFPTEYRKAVARLMSAVLWAHAREHLMPDSVKRDGLPQRPGDWLRAHFRKQFGRRIAARYFT